MLKNNDIISPYQIAMIIIMAVISVGVFYIAAEVADDVGADAWLVVAAAGLLNIFAVLIIVRLNCRFPGKTFAEYSPLIIGTIPGKILIGLFSVYTIMSVAYFIRSFSEVVKMFLLFRTPTEVIMLSLILVCTYIVRAGVECIARVSEILFPIVFIPFFAVMLFGLPMVNFDNLLPIFQASPGQMLNAAPVLVLCFGGIECALFYIGFMKDPRKAYKPALIAVLFITAFLVMVTALCIAAYGHKTVSTFIWPLVVYIRKINLPGLFIERLDGVMLSFWILAVFAAIITFYYIAGYSISKVVGTKEYKQYILPLVIIIYYIALQPESLVELYVWVRAFFPWVISFFLYFVPIVLLSIAKMRKLGVH